MKLRTYLLIPVVCSLAACGGGGNPLIPQLRPVEGGYISSGFGEREQHPVLGYVPGRHHDGYDIAVAAGTPVHASIDGEVLSAGWLGGYGNAVVLRHANGYTTLYGHASELLVRPGQHVARGDLIARVGSTGLSTGPHLHYELRQDGVAVDPGAFDDGSTPTARRAEPARTGLVEATAASYHIRTPAARPQQRTDVATWLPGESGALIPDRPACEDGLAPRLRR